MQAIRSMSVGFKVNYADEINNNNMSSKDIDDIIRMYTTNWSVLYLKMCEMVL